MSLNVTPCLAVSGAPQCLNFGWCSQKNATFFCTCNSGWGGADCSVRLFAETNYWQVIFFFFFLVFFFSFFLVSFFFSLSLLNC